MIKLKKALELMEAVDRYQVGKQFSISFVTANVGRSTGGRVIHARRAILARNARHLMPHSQMRKTDKVLKGVHSDVRNIINLDDNSYLKVHKYLITEFNGEPVQW